MNLKKLLIIFLVILSGVFYYYLTLPYANTTGNIIKQNTDVLRIIDGDTVDTGLGKVRLLGVNTPEKGMPFHDEAEEFLRDLIQNKTIELQLIEGNEKDKYNRTLAYIFSNDKEKTFANREIIKSGFANFYSYEEDAYTRELKDTEQAAIKEQKGIWQKSSKTDCIKFLDLKYEESTRCTNDEKLALQNTCNENINVIIKDNANHIYREQLKAESEWTKEFSCVWNDEGDRLFVWDSDGRLILFHSY